jgi:hypothetical protein
MGAVTWKPEGKWALLSDCGRWAINKAGNPPTYMLAKLGRKSGELWIGSEIVLVGSLSDCKAAAG